MTEMSSKLNYWEQALTSHAIVREPLAELVHNNEEDAERVATHHFALMD